MNRCLLLLLATLVASGGLTATGDAQQSGKNKTARSRMIDFVCPTYGGRIRQVFNPNGDEHNLYHYRTPFNADNSYLLGIETPKGSDVYRVTLYNGDGQFIKSLFTAQQYDWRLAWDRRNPRILYTWKGANLYQYDVTTAKAQLLKSFAPLGLKPCGPSLNQTGDRILVATSDDTVRSYGLPNMDDERLTPISVPSNHYVKWDKLRFIGHQDYFAVTCQEKTASTARYPPRFFTRIYDASTGKLFHTFDQIDIGHHDFSPAGKFAYIEGYPRTGIKVHVVDIDGTHDRVVYEVPRDKMKFVRNYHITWPDNVADWFLLSFFPQMDLLPEAYSPPLDELIQIHVDGRTKVLARTGTSCGSVFWAQPQQAPSADGTRVVFHTNGECDIGKVGVENSDTIDICILYMLGAPPHNK